MPFKPPRWGEKVLALFLNDDDRQALLGDFAEEYYVVARCVGPGQAWRWYWLEILKSIPALIVLFKNKSARRYTMTSRRSFFENQTRMAGIGFVLIIPALILCLGGILQSFLGNPYFNEAINFDLFVFRPAVILGGLALAFGLNVLAVCQVSFRREGDSLVSTIKVRAKFLSLGSIALSLGLVSIIFIYLLAENFQIFAR
jgi:hypothetical protein